jgi:4-hydroxyacetophenone monooxygenase
MEGHSYYVNEHGRSGVNMPWEAQDYHAMIVTPNLEDYDLR